MFPDWIIVSREFSSHTKTSQLWIVRSFTEEAVLRKLLEHCTGHLLGPSFSCAKLSTIAKERRFEVDSGFVQGFKFGWLPHINSADHMLSADDNIMEDDSIDEEVFQDLVWGEDWCAPILRQSLEDQRKVIATHLPDELVHPFLMRFQHGTRWIKNFSEGNISDAISKLDLTSPNKELRWLQHRLEVGNDQNVDDIRIDCPDGSTHYYCVQWFRAEFAGIGPVDKERYITKSYYAELAKG